MQLTRRVVLAALVILALDGAYALTRLALEMRWAASSLDRGAHHLEAANFKGAERDFDSARENAQAARRMTGHLGFEFLSYLPGIGSDADAVESLVSAVNHGAEAGVVALDGIHAMDPRDEGLAGALYEDGRVDLAALDVARPYVDDAVDLLAEARHDVAMAPDGNLPQVASAVKQASRRLDSALDAADEGVRMMSQLPRLLGSDGSRRYFLALQSPSEVRGTGGLIGFYGILEANEGRLRIAKLSPITELSHQGTQKVDAPDWFERLYGPIGALHEWQQVNASINFPAVADVILDRYDMVTGERLDGVIAMDPLALGLMTRGTGAVDGGVLGPIDEDNAREVLLRDVYTHFEDRPKAQNKLLRSIVEQFWGSLGSGDIDTGGFSDGLGEAVDTGRIKVFASDPEVQEAMLDLGIDGGYADEASNVQAVFNNNWSANKIDYYLHRTIETHIAFDAGGEATITTTALLTNDAKADEGGLMSGAFIKGQEDGTNTMSLFFLMPEGSTEPSVMVDGRPSDPFRGRDDLSPVAWTIVRVPAGETARVTLTYKLADRSEGGYFPFTLFPQTTVNADEFELTAEGPDGRLLEITSLGDDGSPERLIRGTLDRERRFRIEL